MWVINISFHSHTAKENAGNMSFRLPFLKGIILALDCPVFAVR